MPILKVANVYFNQSGSSRLEYQNDNVVRFFANSMNIAVGTTLNRPSGTGVGIGHIRYNTDLGAYEIYTASGTWENVSTQTLSTAAFLNSNNAFNQANTAANGNVVIRVYESPGTWTKPANFKYIRVIVIGGGGGAGFTQAPNFTSDLPGGGGGSAVLWKANDPTVTGPVAITVGTGGASLYFRPAPAGGPVAGGGGGTSSFGAFASATGGTAGNPGTGLGGSGTGGTINFTGGAERDGSTYLSVGPPSTTPTIGRKYGGGGIITSPTAPTAPSYKGGDGVVIVEEYY